MSRDHTSHMPLLVVDGYNVLRATPRYMYLIDDADEPFYMSVGGSGRVSGGAIVSIDPFERARNALIGDVAAFAQGTYEAVVVFDGAGNLSFERPELRTAGVRVVFSEQGVSADTVIERICVQARHAGRDVALVTSDSDVRYTAGSGSYPLSVTKVSSQLLAQEMETIDREVDCALKERAHTKVKLEDRLSPESRAKLAKLLRD